MSFTNPKDIPQPISLINYTDIIISTTSPNNDDNNHNIMNASNASDSYYPDGEPEDKDFYKAAEWMIKLVFPVIVVVGTLGNAMVLVVLKRGAIRTDNLSFFLSVLAVVDTVFLYSSCFQTWLRIAAGVNLLHLGTWSCKMILFLSQTSLCVSAWMMVIITWQRWYTCAQPFQRCCPTENSKCGYFAVGALLLLLIGLNSHVLFTVKLYKDEGRPTQCAPIEDFDEIVGEAFPYLLIVLYSGVPAILLLVLTGLLAHVLYKSRRALLTSHSASRTTGRDEVRARYTHVTRMLLALSCLWIMLALPQTLLKQFEHRPETAQEYAVYLFLNVLVYVLVFLNHSINFFIYCALMRSFRREVKRTGRQVSSCLTSTVHGGAYCSSTRQESITDIHLGGNHHNHNNYPQHQHHKNHHNHHHHHHPRRHHHHPNHDQHKHNNRGDRHKPLIVKFNIKSGHPGAYAPHQAQTY